MNSISIHYKDMMETPIIVYNYCIGARPISRMVEKYKEAFEKVVAYLHVL